MRRPASGTALLASMLLLSGGCTRTAKEGVLLRLVDSGVTTGVPVISNADLDLIDVRGVLQAPDGRIAVADAALHQVVLLDSTGTLIDRIGRLGSGPGEFQTVALVAYWGDSLAAYDAALHRLSILRRDGTLLRQQLIEAKGLMAATLLGIRADGAPILMGTTLQGGPDERGVQSARTVVVALRADGQRDTVATEYDGLWNSQGPRWYAARAAAAVSDSGVWIGWGGAPELRFIPFDGSASTTYRWAAHTRPTGDAEKQKIRAIAGERNAAPALTADDRFADSLPYFARLLVDPTGGVWVIGFAVPFEAPDSAWRVDPVGGVVQAMPLPGRFRPNQVGVRALLGFWADDDGGYHPGQVGIQRSRGIEGFAGGPR